MLIFDDDDFVEPADESPEAEEAEEPTSDEPTEAGDGDVEPESGEPGLPAEASPEATYSKAAMEAAVAAAVKDSRQQYSEAMAEHRQKWEAGQQQQRQQAIYRQRQQAEARKNQAAQDAHALPSLQDWMSQGGTVDSWNLFNNQRQAMAQQNQVLTRRLDDMENATRVRTQSREIETHLDNGLKAAIKKYPALSSPEWKNRLGSLIYAEAVRVSGANGDMRRLNVAAIAKGLNEAIESSVRGLRKKAGKKAAAAPKGSPSGSPTKPKRGKGKPMNTEEWLDEGFDELEDSMRPRT
ncbi:MAG: hypothetical protein JRF33_25260 [Deltaproteobacteria bacterium]|nr:hypothetical protein [Deltaproteobacteria bacterium]